MNTRKVVMLCLILLLVSTAAHAKIVFSSKRNGVVGVYVMDDDGSNQTLLMEGNPWGARFPYCWSPDGKQILFHSGGLALMNADGTNVRKLIGGNIGSASFSPDGQSIVFDWSFRKHNKFTYGIYIINIKTLKVEAIAPQIMASQCDWSPDGKHIIFSEWRTHGVHTTIWIIDADGDNRRPLVPAPAAGGEFTIYRSRPRWSPDGKQIVFLQTEFKLVRLPGAREGPFFKAFRYMICNHNGENVRRLHIPEGMEGLDVSWMDDGESIVFSARAVIPLNEPLPGDFDFPPPNIYKYNIRTRVRTRLTNHPGTDVTVDWISDDVLPVSPQGKKKITWGTLKQ